jgi:hypothetical protein
VQSNRSAIGAAVTVETSAGKQTQVVHSGSSYCSQSDLALTFGLGAEDAVKSIDVQWPSGKKDHLTGVKANQRLNIQEGKGQI